MSANFFGNQSQGYFGFYFGPTAESDTSVVVESLHVADALSATVVFPVSRDESLSVADDQSQGSALAASLSESLVAAETISATVVFLGAVVEALESVESTGVQTDFLAALDESVSISSDENAESAGNSVNESLSVSDLSTCVLTPNPTPDNSATTMAPSAGASIDKSSKRARPLRYNYDGEAVQIKMYPDPKTVVVRGAARDLVKSSSFVNGRVSYVQTHSFGVPRRETIVSRPDLATGIVTRISSSRDFSKAIHSASPSVSRVSSAKGMARGYGLSSGIATRYSSAKSMVVQKSGAQGFATILGQAKTSKIKGYGMANGEQITEFTEEQMEMILAVAEREFFR